MRPFPLSSYMARASAAGAGVGLGVAVAVYVPVVVGAGATIWFDVSASSRVSVVSVVGGYSRFSVCDGGAERLHAGDGFLYGPRLDVAHLDEGAVDDAVVGTCLRGP